MSEGLAVLADFQSRARDALSGAILRAAEYADAEPSRREAIGRTLGVMLLESPTGSGKTLTLGRTLEAVRGRLSGRCVWFWFAPYLGLVAQTRDALSDQCPGLRLRDLKRDRAAASARDGDVYVQTWASVAKTNKEALTVRRSGGDGPESLDAMLEALRADGARIGVVIDEAHLNFGDQAKAAATFYLDVLRPDFTLLATATPRDETLAKFERLAGIRVESRVTVARDEVVRAGLNKRGLKLGVIEFRDEAARLVDPQTAALVAGWEQHQRVKRRLQARGLKLTPLMLVQVEDQAKGGPDPVRQVETLLVEAGVPKEAIAVHTSGEPDPDFHALAYDDRKEVLVFKVAVATGFDAPRAWTLVSVRPNRGLAFGLQIVGRVMRVHPQVRPIHGQDDVLDRAYVILSNGAEQGGLEAAAAELRAVRSSIATIADELAVRVVGGPDAAPGRLGAPLPPRSPEERAARLDALVREGLATPDARLVSADEQDRLIANLEYRRSLREGPLFGALFDDLPQAPAAPAPPPGRRTIPLRQDLPLPRALLQERLPDPALWNRDVAEETAKRLFTKKDSPVDCLLRTKGRVSLSLRDLFLAELEEEQEISVRWSDARVAELAQRAFEFNDQLDPRRFKRALIEQFRRTCDDRGIEADDLQMRRALELFAMTRPRALEDAMREVLAQNLVVEPGPPLEPLPVEDGVHLRKSRLSAWGVYPSNMNSVEYAFAEFLDRNGGETVRWWLRLQESAAWAATVLLPNGRRFFPDFAIGVNGRKTDDGVALVEIKDDGTTGRLHADQNLVKIKVSHKAYLKVHWAVRDESGVWANMVLDSSGSRIVPAGDFTVDLLLN